MSFNNQTFIVTGGASGLGEAAVRDFIAKGANVAILDRDNEKGEAVAKECGPKASFFYFDAMKEETIKTAINAVVAKFGALNGVVNSAGLGYAMLTLGRKGPHSSEVFDFVLKINLFGTFNVCKYAAEAMSKNDADEYGLRGVLINVASVAGFEGQKGQVAYAASKGGVIGMTLPMARDLGTFGIRVMTIAPGSIATPLMLAAPEKVRTGLLENIVAPKRLGLPKEFAQLCSSIVENKYLNGETIRLDGGIRMGYRSKV